MPYIVVSALGTDQPGLVNRITSAVVEHGGNIEMQRSAHMAEEFAVMMLCAFSGDVGPAVDTLRALSTERLQVNARETTADAEGRDAVHAELTASGADQPGIIDALSGLLYRHSVNIESMDYDVEYAPMSGQPLFRMESRLLVPAGADLNAVRDEIRELESELHFDVILRYPVDGR